MFDATGKSKELNPGSGALNLQNVDGPGEPMDDPHFTSTAAQASIGWLAALLLPALARKRRRQL